MQLPNAEKYRCEPIRPSSRSRGQRNEHKQRAPGHGGSIIWRPWFLFFLAVLLVSVIRSCS